MRVLIVDDEPAIIDVLRTHLEHAGHRVTSTSGLFSALEAIRATDGGRRFDAVVLDMHLPDGDGPVAIQAIASIDPALIDRLVIMSGDTTLEEMFPSRFLGKPFRFEELDRLLYRFGSRVTRPRDAGTRPPRRDLDN